MMNSLEKYQHSIPIMAIILIIMLPISAFFLRQNNLGMLERLEEVNRIDRQTGDIEQIEPALNDLRQYVLTHMNTDIGDGVQLQGAYNSAVEEAREQAERSGSANAQVYRLAQQKCEDPSVLLQVRAQCIQDFVLDNAAPGTDPQELEFPPRELYVYDFISPLISFDAAGISVIMTAVVAVWLSYLVLSTLLLRRIKRWIDSDPLE